PSFRARSAPLPSSNRSRCVWPGLIVTLSGVVDGFWQSMFNAATGIGCPACATSGRSTPKNGLLLHLTALLTFRRPPVTVFPASAVIGSVDARSTFLIFLQSHVGCAAATSAAAPATCGADIDVPERNAYVLPLYVLRTLTPGAPSSTVRRPQFENDALPSFRSVAATERMFG